MRTESRYPVSSYLVFKYRYIVEKESESCTDVSIKNIVLGFGIKYKFLLYFQQYVFGEHIDLLTVFLCNDVHLVHLF